MLDYDKLLKAIENKDSEAVKVWLTEADDPKEAIMERVWKIFGISDAWLF